MWRLQCASIATINKWELTKLKRDRGNDRVCEITVEQVCEITVEQVCEIRVEVKSILIELIS